MELKYSPQRRLYIARNVCMPSTTVIHLTVLMGMNDDNFGVTFVVGCRRMYVQCSKILRKINLLAWRQFWLLAEK